MNGADLVILGILLVSIVVSLVRGFIKEVFSILVWVAAIFAAFQVAGPLAGALEPIIELPSARIIVAFAAVFVLVLVIGGLISFLVGKMVEKTGLSPTDRFFGGVFGLARGLVIVVLAVLLLRVTPFAQDPWWNDSRLLPTFEALAEEARVWLPESVRGLLDPENQSARSAVSEESLPTLLEP
ncbi:MAG TPA: CvpA family protein [Wenzhouxiangellaceae bacterium]|nr:CvpA family protein [Wenzhouxiangellaceae bacterium]